MKTVIKNATILPMTERNKQISGDILIDDGIIKSAGGNAEADDALIIDGRNHIAIPSFINAHTHLSMVLMRNYKDTCSELMSWLSEIFPIEDKLNEDDIYAASLLGAAELIKSGTTCFADMYFMSWQTVRAIKEAGIRGIIGQTFFGDEKETERRISELYPRTLEAIDGDDRFRIDAAVHSIYTCTEGTYRRAAEWAREIGGYLNTHLSETRTELDGCMNEHGMRPAEYLDSIGAFIDGRTYLAHGVWLDDKELEIIKHHNASIVHNPISNCKLASGIADIHHYKEMGINVALGTDGASSNNNLNMLKEANAASLLCTVSNMSPAAMTPYDILRMATADSAKALGLSGRIGTIEAGKDADITLINTDSVNMTPLNDPYSAIVFSADKSDIDYVFSKGKAVLEKGNLTTLDEDEIKYNTIRQWNDILRR